MKNWLISLTTIYKSPKKIAELVQKTSLEWEGLRIICKIMICNKQIDVTVVPSVSVLIIKSLNRAVRDRKKEKNIYVESNISMDTVISIAKSLKRRRFLNNFRGYIKEIIGTAFSLNCLIENKIKF